MRGDAGGYIAAHLGVLQLFGAQPIVPAHFPVSHHQLDPRHGRRQQRIHPDRDRPSLRLLARGRTIHAASRSRAMTLAPTRSGTNMPVGSFSSATRSPLAPPISSPPASSIMRSGRLCAPTPIWRQPVETTGVGVLDKSTTPTSGSRCEAETRLHRGQTVRPDHRCLQRGRRLFVAEDDPVRRDHKGAEIRTGSFRTARSSTPSATSRG